ncbi:helix-turn-helix transcriptional regulator [Streptomyces sp. NPDC048718]|uniref:helix-turn-helix transcriptional regulator n=1 Tax=Streptomyces sp. NPDC048718 TaxID=3365587 RepID=UPI0037219F0D
MVTLESTDSRAARRAELRAFLMNRRARVSPAEAGLPEGGARRRTPGLRREEVAVLAGVGASWYQWLEQGRDISVSPHVLDSVARVLRLSPVERRHLYVLAGLNPPAPETAPADLDMYAGLRRLIDTWMPFPAVVMDVYWNAVLYNDAASIVFGLRPEAPGNCLVSFFTDPIYQSRIASWEETAPRVVAQFRAACSDNPGDDGFMALVEEVAAASAVFAELWGRQDILPGGQNRKELEHPVVGALVVESTQLRVPARPDLVLSLHTPLPEADTAAKLEWLVSPEGRRGAMYEVAS